MAHATSLIPHYSATTTNEPDPTDMQIGEISWNITDGKVWSTADSVALTLIVNPDGFFPNSNAFDAQGRTMHDLGLYNTSEKVGAEGNVTGSTGLDINASPVFTATATGDTTFTFDNVPDQEDGVGFTLVFTNGGAHTITWPTSVDWPGGTAPTLTTSGTDVLVFFTPDGGTTWHGVASLLDSQ